MRLLSVNGGQPMIEQTDVEAAQNDGAETALAAAYTYLQRVVGLIAVALPIVVVGGNFLLGGELLGSISAYYYTSMGRVFVGSLCALAVFFLSYNYRPLPSFELDNVLSTIASVAAVGVAFFPTTDDASSASDGEKTVAFVHLCCAATLFLLLAYFSLFLFTRSGECVSMTAEKVRRNVVYRTCGCIIAASIALVVVANWTHAPASWHALLVLETVCVVAFGYSWLVKGGFCGWFADK